MNTLGSRRVTGEALVKQREKIDLSFISTATTIIICLNIQMINFIITILSCSKHPTTVVTPVGFKEQWKMLAVKNIF